MVYYNIKEIRKFKNLTVDFVAAELQVSIDYYKAIENGEIDLKISRLFIIAEIFDVFVSDLFCWGNKN
jgi:transcriptional regulator with XRE-family HTH domain